MGRRYAGSRTNNIMDRSEVIANQIGLTDKPLKGIEIGCWSGDFAMNILKRFKNLHLTSIDPAPKITDIYNKLLQGDVSAEPKFKLIVDTSDNVIRYLSRDYDFVFIDGDHSYEQTRRDILNYWQVIKKGGLLCGHNYEEHGGVHAGVKQAVHEIFGAGNFSSGDDITWWKFV